MSNPTITVTVNNPGLTTGQSSYFDITISGSNSYLNGVYDAWCADLDTAIEDRTYQATVYSSYETNNLNSVFPNIENKFNLDSVNWLLNQNFIANPQYNYGEIQAAIWTLLGDPNYKINGNDLTATGTVNLTDVTALVNLALANGNNFVPDNNEYIGVLLDTFQTRNDGSILRRQPIIVPIKAAKLGDFVWEDKDADGIQDSGEQGIAGAIVNLGRDSNNDGDINDAGELLATTTTDNLGGYQFKGLTPGLNYQVEFVQPSGFNGVSPREQGSNTTVDSDGLLSDVVVLAAGEYNQTIDAGFYKYASLGNFVWKDIDADGIQDASENGIANVTVELLNSSNNVIASTQTDSDGKYNFTDLIPGTYSVRFVPPNGYTFSNTNVGSNDAIDSDANVVTGTTQQVTLTSGEYNDTIDAGLFEKACLGDFVWEDKDADGIQDADEQGIAGASVYLGIDADSDGFFDNTEIFAETVTNANGFYKFNDLVPGQYQVFFQTPNGYNSVSPREQGGDNTKDSDGLLSDVVTLTSGEENLTIDAGFYKYAGLGNFVWNDVNMNGIQDAGEAGINNVTVNLYDANGGFLNSTTTTSSGFYSFDNLVPSTYQVEFRRPDDYIFSPVDVGSNDAIDSDANTTTGFSPLVTLMSGEYNPTIDAGMYKNLPTSSLGDFVWHDLNRNGIQDANEAGIEGIKVTLVGSGANGIFGDGDDITKETFTNSTGKYLFNELAAGTYKVIFEPNAIFNTFSPALQGSDTAKDSNADPLTGMTGVITLGANQTNLTIDAGLYIDITIIPPPSGGSEGLTPGFWKNWATPDKKGRYPWANTDYSPTREASINSSSQSFGDPYLYQSVFGVQLSSRLSASEIASIDKDGDGVELLETLNANGNTSGQALLRHSTAALLNSAHSSIDYPYSTGEVIAIVKQAFVTGELDPAKDLFATANELGGVI
jgi:protocatechuate 3,4-dioxygenase beta subunit